jgi:F0F1-type ATP synthase assembly protein I
MTSANKDDINNLEQRLAKLQQQRQQDNKPSSFTNISQATKEKTEAFNYIAEFTIPIFVMIFIGIIADKYFHTMPLFSIILGLSGFAVGIINLIKKSNNYDINRLGYVKQQPENKQS